MSYLNKTKLHLSLKAEFGLHKTKFVENPFIFVLIFIVKAFIVIF
jgi:hypothetical protein